ncbi:SpoIIE family protein phosphatase [Streptomyces coeruleorubidus]
MPGPCAEGSRRGRSWSARRRGRRSAGFGEIRDAQSVVDGVGASDSFLLAQDGHAQYLDAGQGLLLGAGSGTLRSRPNAAQSLPPGSTLLLYTDGLIEIPAATSTPASPDCATTPRSRPRTARHPVRSATRPHAARQHRRRGPARPADAVLNHDVCNCRRGHPACRVVTERYPPGQWRGDGFA